MSQEHTEGSESLVEVVEYSRPGEDRVFTHTYDGIEEYDNPMPGWWINIFWLSILFSVFYVGYYHLSGRATTIHQDYEEALGRWEMKQAEVQAAFAKLPLTEQFQKAMADKRNLEKGRLVYEGKGICASCHGKDGGGLVGPNLTDDFWINGPTPTRKEGPNLRDIFRVITYGGRPGKQMQPWKDILSPVERVQVSLYVASLRGKKIAKPKPVAPEARRYKYTLSPIVP